MITKKARSKQVFTVHSFMPGQEATLDRFLRDKAVEWRMHIGVNAEIFTWRWHHNPHTGEGVCVLSSYGQTDRFPVTCDLPGVIVMFGLRPKFYTREEFNLEFEVIQ